MGASSWNYLWPYTEDPAGMLAGLHRTVLEQGTYWWADENVPRPASLTALHELYANEANEALATNGTHSILDVFQLAPAGSEDDYFTIMPLTDEQILAVFGTARPSRSDFDAVSKADPQMLYRFQRWSGRFTTLFDGDAPSQIVVWGYSGD